ncbi:MAG: bifunctional serine/threonine-protein kinase/formylglycine-generating enzyme family protein [Chthoniobacteraceae bacterium]
MSADPNPHEPPRVPNHELVRVIGRGSYGEIWMARSELGIMRAVKIVDRRTFESVTAFQREFDGMARFEPISREHAGFVDILHVGRDEADEFFYYVMELADDHTGGQHIDPTSYVPKTLKTELSRRSRLLADEVITLGLSLSESLAALHREGLVHRDIKPANIIFVGGRPKIADIGLVAASGQASYVGTEGYVPPEGPGTAQGDIFSLGKVLYELAMGKDRLEFPALNTDLDELPDKELLMRLNDVFLRACANDSAERYERVEQMHADLARIREGKPLQRLGGGRWPLVLVAVLLLGGGGAYYARLAVARGSATIETDPPGAMVLIGDRMVRSPAHFDSLPVGEQNVRVMMPGYEPEQRRVTIEGEKNARLPAIPLTRSHGAAQLDSTPTGATFELRDGSGVVKAGRLPAELRGLFTGEYTLVARLDGRERSMPVEIRREETTTLDVVFPEGSVAIASLPRGVVIVVDGKPAGQTPLTLTLPDGPHEIVAKYRRWPDQRRSVNVDPAKPAELMFDFPPGSVKITSAPGGASVIENGSEIGQTPLLLEDREPGPIHFELRLAGFEPLPLDGVVKPGEQTFLGKSFAMRVGPQRGQPWENSLGMKFAPIAAGDGPFADVLMAVWLTRVRDFAVFAAAKGRTEPRADFAQDENHPVVRVSYKDAEDFCKWLTEMESAAGKLAEGQRYRLPADLEWSAAAGLADEGRKTPEERDGKVREFAWGKQWPPPPGSGNFADTSLKRSGQASIAGYHDGFPQTSPVGSFAANKLGLHDMSGNAWQWILEPYSPGSRWGVLRGGSWATDKPAELSLSYRNVVDPTGHEVIYGFRCVLVVEGKE